MTQSAFKRLYNAQAEEVKHALHRILKEYHRAIIKHPNWPTDIVHRAAIVGEESGELTRAAINNFYEGGAITLVEQEAIQTAATAIRLIVAQNTLPG